MTPAKRTKTNDTWLVRLPDGQVLQANSTAAVRHHIETGRIPHASQVRRSPDEEWIALEWTREFSAAVTAEPAQEEPPASPPRRPGSSPDLSPTGIAHRLDPLRLKTVGVRGLVEELVAALDGTFVRGKLLSAAVAGVVLLAAGQAVQAGAVALRFSEGWAVDLVTAAVGLVALAVAAAPVTRMTFVEVSRMRPARRREVTAGLVPMMLRLAMAVLLVPGVLLAAIILLRHAPALLAASGEGARAVAVAGPVAEVGLWLLFGVSWLLVPVVVVEEGGPGAALGEWLSLIRGHRSRAFLYEALALALGGLVTVPFLAPVWLAFGGRLSAGDPAAELAARVLTGLAVAPFLTFLMVANVFIYLNLRYEAHGGE